MISCLKRGNYFPEQGNTFSTSFCQAPPLFTCINPTLSIFVALCQPPSTLSSLSGFSLSVYIGIHIFQSLLAMLFALSPLLSQLPIGFEFGLCLGLCHCQPCLDLVYICVCAITIYIYFIAYVDICFVVIVVPVYISPCRPQVSLFFTILSINKIWVHF